ncbi:uncharacterized protein LOC119599248 [Penaeus monodon]|uniref:uncharacterized protein LOC119599248 n=1 Tax=Penaeus monodon TaxID=6687 RepID=UPI0018A7D506|nr:uncharacterized protein LOC119599248 [Penaeus monodon]
MFVSIRTTRASTPLSLGDREFAIRFFCIVVTDCLCWIPIIVLKYLAMMGLDIHPKLYAYVVVVLLPINSALNPFLYTFTTSKFRSRASQLCTMQVLCHKSHAVDIESEATRTSLLRGATCRGSAGGGREGIPLQTHFIIADHLVGVENGAGAGKMTRVRTRRAHKNTHDTDEQDTETSRDILFAIRSASAAEAEHGVGITGDFLRSASVFCAAFR